MQAFGIRTAPRISTKTGRFSRADRKQLTVFGLRRRERIDGRTLQKSTERTDQTLDGLVFAYVGFEIILGTTLGRHLGKQKRHTLIYLSLKCGCGGVIHFTYDSPCVYHVFSGGYALQKLKTILFNSLLSQSLNGLLVYWRAECAVMIAASPCESIKKCVH